LRRLPPVRFCDFVGKAFLCDFTVSAFLAILLKVFFFPEVRFCDFAGSKFIATVVLT
jgi:hypothetical protein